MVLLFARSQGQGTDEEIGRVVIWGAVKTNSGRNKISHQIFTLYCGVLFCLGYIINRHGSAWLINPYNTELLHWYQAPVPVKESRIIWVRLVDTVFYLPNRDISKQIPNVHMFCCRSWYVKSIEIFATQYKKIPKSLPAIIQNTFFLNSVMRHLWCYYANFSKREDWLGRTCESEILDSVPIGLFTR